MNVLRKAATAAVLLAAAAPVAPASAACFGSATTARICVHNENLDFSLTGGDGVDECVTVLAPPCHDVHVPTPSVGTSGPLYSAECYACSNVPGVVGTVTDAAEPFVERAYQIADQVSRLECAPYGGGSDAYEPPPPPVVQNVRDFLDSCLS